MEGATKTESKKKKKKKKPRSRSVKASKRVEEEQESQDHHEFKGKDGPDWKRQLLDMKTKLQRISIQLVQKLQHDEEFRQKAFMYFAIASSVLIVAAYVLQAPADAMNVAASTGSDVEDIQVSSKATPEPKLLTKRERERAEGLDLEGKSDLISVRRRYSTSEDEYTKAQLKARKTLSSKVAGCLTFPPQITRNSEKYTYYCPRKVFDLPVLQRSFRKLGWEQETDLKKATLVLKGVPRVASRQLVKGEMYMDMVLSLGRIGSKKKTQLATLRNHVRKFGCTFESLNIQPKSFDMNKPADCKKFFSYPDTGKMWVLKSCKNGEGSKGAGVTVYDTLQGLRSEWSSCEQGAFDYVAQEYITHPLLLKKSKFDIRSYIFVASTDPFVVFFNPGYIRRAMVKYDSTSTKKEDILTNVHVSNQRSDYDPEEAMWPFPRFIEYLQEENLCEACGDIEIAIAKISRLVFDSGKSYYKRFPGTFQLAGLDFMLDAYLNVFFIEGNVSPGLGSHSLSWKSNLMSDLVTMMYSLTTQIQETPDQFDMRVGERIYGPKGNYWELLVHEQYERCDGKSKFDPCKELKGVNY